MSEKVKKQHFVPQFLLRNFADLNGKLWIYDKTTGRTFPNGVSNIGCNGYFYDDAEVTRVTGEAQFVEKLLSRAERRWSSTLKEVLERIRSQPKIGLTLTERLCISQMIALQMVRTPLARDMNEQMKESLARVLAKANEQDSETAAPLPEELSQIDAKNLHVTSMLNHENIATYQTIFNSHIWIFLRASKHGSFYISDHPLAKRPHLQGGWRSNSGIASKGIEISFPLAHDVVLLMYDRGYFSKMELSDGNASDANSPDMLLYYNSMQVQTSQRFLYSRHNEFSHADLVLKEEPRFRNPNRKHFVVSGDADYPNGQ
jgi:hypothetical protein